MTAILLWVLSLAALMLLAGGWPGRGSHQAQPIAVETSAPAPVVEAPAPWRPSPRPALQTGAAILALALALDVSAPPQAWATSAEAVYAAAAPDESPLVIEAPQPWIAVEPAADWALKAIGTTDGWLI